VVEHEQYLTTSVVHLFVAERAQSSLEKVALP